ncbi:hypothetical protein GCM10009757_05600 [Streptomyces cheonanensis]|uniref:Uncharacterized protein n=1 Tax=Streptomyces cheonanensis TaxID=312720 RepID=A0ABP5GA21_9ACTN
MVTQSRVIATDAFMLRSPFLSTPWGVADAFVRRTGQCNGESAFWGWTIEVPPASDKGSDSIGCGRFPRHRLRSVAAPRRPPPYRPRARNPRKTAGGPPAPRRKLAR